MTMTMTNGTTEPVKVLTESEEFVVALKAVLPTGMYGSNGGTHHANGLENYRELVEHFEALDEEKRKTLLKVIQSSGTMLVYLDELKESYRRQTLGVLQSVTPGAFPYIKYPKPKE